MTRLIKGSNWDEVILDDRCCNTLFVFFSALFQPQARFPHFKRSSDIKSHKLFFIDSDNDFYSQNHDEILHKISQFIASFNIKKVVFWGYSGGAYLAIFCGMEFINISTVVAISPHLRLNRPRTRAFEIVKDVDESYNDLRSRLKVHSAANIYLLMPCYSLRDWPHVLDATDLRNENVRIYYLALDHGIEADLLQRGQLLPIMRSLVQSNSPALENLPEVQSSEIVFCKLGWSIFETLEQGLIDAFSWPKDDQSRNSWWFDIKGRYCAALGLMDDALTAANKAVSLNPHVSQHYVSLAHYLSRVGSNQLATMSYILALVNDNRDQWLVEHLKRIGGQSSAGLLKDFIGQAIQSAERQTEFRDAIKTDED